MSHFWAKFKFINGETFRLDTRIYLQDVDFPKSGDSCIGAIVGKNPGSAKPSTLTDKLQSIELDGDKLLPTVRNIITKAYLEADVAPPERGYVQVLNLFYLCNQNLSLAFASIGSVAEPLFCESEAGCFPWVWYVWGNQSAQLDQHKERFSRLNANHHFFFDHRAKEIKGRSPSWHEFAKHTQGLKHNDVIPYIAKLIANG